MLKRLVIAATIVGLAPLPLAGAAWAHGPSRQKVEETIEINAPVDKVWKVVGNFQDMSWLSIVAKTEGKGGNDINATRTLTLKGGKSILEEELSRDDAKMAYIYKILGSGLSRISYL